MKRTILFVILFLMFGISIYADKTSNLFVIERSKNANVVSYDAVLTDDGKIKEAFEMNNPSEGLLIEPMVWRSMQEFTPDCIMMAVCDRPFDPGNETWDDYQIFLEKVREG